MPQSITKYHAKYYAHLLTQKAIGDGINSLSQSLLSASVDINPHQIEAALFAFKSPLSKGVVLADEVGLGKTIEAGLVLCQYWAVGKRKIIVVCPAALRKQWSFELTDKFGIANEILDTKNFNEYIRNGKNPLVQKRVVICSYNFVARHRDDIRLHNFDLAVIDEAHKLRNVYRNSAKTANAVKDALGNTKKLLLTATPFQNSLMELYGLTSIINENIFGSAKSFRSNYGSGDNNSDLRDRLQNVYIRTLRKDVKEYINYTNRLPLTQNFDTTDVEFELYQEISEFLRRDDIYSVPRQQKKLTTMIIRKILASSTYALISTLTNIKQRLEKMLAENVQLKLDLQDLVDDEDEMEIIAAEADDEGYGEQDHIEEEDDDTIDTDKLKAEIALLGKFIDKAHKIGHDSKSDALLTALEQSFAMQAKTGAARKALIFTESTKTQAYLRQFLEANGYDGKIVLFNGRGSNPESTRIYNEWVLDNPNRVSGIRAADRRLAVVDYFRNTAEIMIATEAAAEGLNLQFCSLVINYDLPWNPQRIEQRIGRCHRYGQKFDVVVVNFVNRRNYADVRVFALLQEKFNLFDDIFGASDEVLGRADAIDFESRIWEIYQQCRTEDEINAAFNRLQEDMQTQIDERMQVTRAEVLEHFDIDVQERLRLAKSETGAFLNRYEHIFWALTRYILADVATFDDEHHSFTLHRKVAGCPATKYDLLSQVADGVPYRLSHPLAQHVIARALTIDTDTSADIVFDSADTAVNVALPTWLKGAHGYMVLTNLDISSFEDEQYTLFTAFTDDGHFLTQEECEKLFLLGGTEQEATPISDEILRRLGINADQHVKGKLADIDSRNLDIYHEEENRIYRWERDVVDAIERELDQVKRNIREADRQARAATNIEEKIALERRAEELRSLKRRKRNELEDREDEVAERRRHFIKELENRMIKSSTCTDVFHIGWRVK